MRAGVDFSTTVARPLGVRWVEGDGWRNGLPGRLDADHDGVAAILPSEGSALTGELDALGPEARKTGFPDGFEKTVSELGRKNVQEFYKTDYEIYNWCVKRREELLPIRRAELEARMAAAQ